MTNQLDVDVNVAVQGAQSLDSVGQGFDQAGQKARGFGSIGTGVLQGVGQAVTSFGIGLAQAGISAAIDAIGNSVELSSAKAEAASKANVIFGDSYGIIEDKSKSAATEVGVSSGKYLELAGNVGNLVTNFGFAGDEAANMSTDIVQLAADVGSFNNAPTADVVGAIGAAFRGETEPIRAFGVMLDDASVKAKALELGLYDGVGALDKNAKATATYQLILEQTTKAQGDFARTSDGLANQQKIANARIEDSLTRIGDVITPLAADLVPLLADAVAGLVDIVMSGVGVIQDLADRLSFLKPILDLVATAANLAGDALGWVTSTAGGTVQGLDQLKPKFVEVATQAGLTADEIDAAWTDAASGIADGSVRTDAALQAVIDAHNGAAIAVQESAARQGQAIRDLVVQTTENAAAMTIAVGQGAQDQVAALNAGLEDGVDIVAMQGLRWQHQQQETADRMREDALALGKGVPSEIGQGMEAKSHEILDAADRLVSLLKNGLSPGEQAARLSGEKYTKAVAEGVTSEIPGAKDAAVQVALAAINTIEDAGLDGAKGSKGLKAIGQYYDSLLMSGLTAEQARLALTGAGVASDVIDGLETKNGAFTTTGNTQANNLSDALANKPWGTYGANVGDAWVDGAAKSISGGRSKLADAAWRAMQHLIGSSPPKTGPLRDVDLWGENVGHAWVDGMADGIAGGRQAIGQAAARLAPGALAGVDTSSRARAYTGGPGPVVNIYAGVGDPVEIGRQVSLVLAAYQRTSGVQAG